MIARHESSTHVALFKGPRRQYTLMFRANGRGLAKRVELWADDVNGAVELALADQSFRTVDIWEDDGFLCRISRMENSRDPYDADGHAQ